jgi:hypothetical protein
MKGRAWVTKADNHARAAERNGVCHEEGKQRPWRALVEGEGMRCEEGSTGPGGRSPEGSRVCRDEGKQQPWRALAGGEWGALVRKGMGCTAALKSPSLVLDN